MSHAGSLKGSSGRRRGVAQLDSARPVSSGKASQGRAWQGRAARGRPTLGKIHTPGQSSPTQCSAHTQTQLERAKARPPLLFVCSALLSLVVIVPRLPLPSPILLCSPYSPFASHLSSRRTRILPSSHRYPAVRPSQRNATQRNTTQLDTTQRILAKPPRFSYCPPSLGAL